jgi:adenylate kinase
MDAAPRFASTATHKTAPLMRPAGRVLAGQVLRVVLIGPPGAGKGTQAGTLADLAGVAHVASGDLFREASKSDSGVGRRIRAYMDRGELVPDDLTVAMVIDRLLQPDCRRGFVLDGFPRSRGQAEALDRLLEDEGSAIECVVDLQVPVPTLLARLSGRWLCRSCHASYHAQFSPPTAAGACDRCGDELYQRTDDREETARRRLEVYVAETLPVLDYYRQRGILFDVPGDGPIREVTRRLHHRLLSR